MPDMPMMPEPVRVTKKEVFGGVEMETIYRQGKTPVDPKDENRDAGGPGMNSMGMGVCPALNPRTYECAPGILCEQDVAVKMRDGVTIYSNHQNCRHPSGRQLFQLPLSQKLESHQGFLRFWGFGS